MLISLVTDELSADLETAIELGTDWGIKNFELRGYGSQRVPMLTDYQKQRVKELLEAYGAKIVAISPGLFKIPYVMGNRERFAVQAIDEGLYRHWRDGRSLVQYHLNELLPASIEYAKEIGTSKIVAFSFDRGENAPDKIPDEILEILQSAALLTEKAGLQLLIEVEVNFWVDSGRHAVEVLRAINNPSVGVNWDPGNGIQSGERPYPEGYEHARGFIQHIHFKDSARTPEGGFQHALEGMVDWSGQIKALAADGYAGYLSVEHHLQPKVASTKAAIHRLQKLIADAQTNVK